MQKSQELIFYISGDDDDCLIILHVHMVHVGLPVFYNIILKYWPESMRNAGPTLHEYITANADCHRDSSCPASNIVSYFMQVIWEL